MQSEDKGTHLNLLEDYVTKEEIAATFRCFGENRGALDPIPAVPSRRKNRTEVLFSRAHRP
jgi:hypothetical protein